MRPTPPTGSSGSTSVSPAVGQGNLCIRRPRPILPKLTSHGLYLQPLGPRPAATGYVMISGRHPSVQPQHHQQKKQQPQRPNQPPLYPQGQQYCQGNYVPNPQVQLANMQNAPSIGGMQPSLSNNMFPGPAGQYPENSLPIYVPLFQFGDYQSCNSSNISQCPPPNVMPGNAPVSQPNTSAQSGPRSTGLPTQHLRSVWTTSSHATTSCEASGEDPRCIPQSRKEETVAGGSQSHPATAHSTGPSQDAATGPTESPRTQVNQSCLRRVCEIENSPGRREWMEKYKQFWMEKGHSILQSPTYYGIPLDVYRLFQYVQKKGGYREVSKNNKWGDVADHFGIDPLLPRRAFTLQRHYCLLLSEFERNSAVHPGPSNSQLSFSTAGSGSVSRDNYPYDVPGNSSSPMRRTISQTSVPSLHSGGLSYNNSQYRAQFPTPSGSSTDVNQRTQQSTPRTVGHSSSQQMDNELGHPNIHKPPQSTPSKYFSQAAPLEEEIYSPLDLSNGSPLDLSNGKKRKRL